MLLNVRAQLALIWLSLSLFALANPAVAATPLTLDEAALVLAACESAWRAPALVIALAEHRIDGENCHQQGINVNLCLAHYLGEDQSLDKPLVKVPALSGAPSLYAPACSRRWNAPARRALTGTVAGLPIPCAAPHTKER